MKMSTVSASLKSVVVVLLMIAASPARAAGTADAGAKTLIDYFLPTPIVCPLTSATWGASTVLPRDICNGLEDSTGKMWTYWDGKIMQEASDGTYHLFASRWPETSSAGFNDWPNAVIVHAKSNSTLMGSYIPDAASPITENGGKGQNVVGATLNDGSYVILTSGNGSGNAVTTFANMFLATSLTGPWTDEGTISFNANGYSTYEIWENQNIWQNATGNFLMVTRPFEMLLSPALTGPYTIQGGSVIPKTVPSSLEDPEDPVIWCSGGQYHMVYNYWESRKMVHLTSVDGIHDWTYQGLAFDPTTDVVRYTDGTVNHWFKAERPAVFLQNGHVTAFSFAVTDVDKQYIVPGSNHDSKVIVVPFDGVTFDRENPGAGSPGCPAEPIGPVDAGEGDAKASGDAGSTDAGVPVDAASPVDGAGASDATAPSDAQVSTEIDAQAEGGGPDAGGGVPSDGGNTDAGSSGSSNASGCSCKAGRDSGANGATGLALLVGAMVGAGWRRRRNAAAR